MAKKEQKKIKVRPVALTKPLDDSELRSMLINTQYELRDTQRLRKKKSMCHPNGLLIMVNGMESSGKGYAVKKLRQWLDPRLLNVEATIGQMHTFYEPIWQRHTFKIPKHGDIGVYFGNWYADLILTTIKLFDLDEVDSKFNLTQQLNSRNSLQENITDYWMKYLSEQLTKLSEFETDLKRNNTQLLKCWFSINNDLLYQRLSESSTDLYKIDWFDQEMVARFNKVACKIIEQQKDWVIINESDKELGSKIFIRHVLFAMQEALYVSFHIEKRPVANRNFVWADVPDKLNDIDDSDLDKSEYKKQLIKKQDKLAQLLRARGNRHIVFAFEGVDAAGKGGAIKRLVAPLDPREYQIYNIGAPSELELDYPYLWRFWTKLPLVNDCNHRIIIFDRTWYGRVLVERVENFATEESWQRAYEEINRFEKEITDNRTILLKYWLAIDKKEQLERFEDRELKEYKKYKLTDEDWRNRSKWKEYIQSASDMLARTNTINAPWFVVATNDKRTARLMVLDYAINKLSKTLL